MLALGVAPNILASCPSKMVRFSWSAVAAGLWIHASVPELIAAAAIPAIPSNVILLIVIFLASFEGILLRPST
jgi:hypothetical protein